MDWTNGTQEPKIVGKQWRFRQQFLRPQNALRGAVGFGSSAEAYALGSGTSKF